MTDIQAAIGRIQLKRLSEFLDRRRLLAERYTQALTNVPGLILPLVPASVRPNYQSFAVRVTSDYPMSRDQLMQSLLERGISTRRGIMNSHQEAAYAGAANYSLPESEDARDNVILLPLFHTMTSLEQDLVIDHLTSVAKRLIAG
jgi:perosamine synthetase